MIMRKQQKGFSLIELMVVVVIIGIISAIALPSYSQYVQRSRCSQAEADLLEIAQWMERRYSVNFSYPDAADLPFNQSPRDGGTVAFNISLVSDTNTFTLTAAGTDIINGNVCGSTDMTLNHQGVRGGDWPG